MTEPTVPPAGEPPVESQGGNTPAPQGKVYTDSDLEKLISGRLKDDREAFEKQLGLSDLGLKIKDVKDILKAKKEADDAKKTELERLTGERDTHKSDAQAARLELAKVKALVKAGVDIKKLDTFLKRVVGSTPEEIEADVLELQEAGMFSSAPPKTGTGSNPANPPDQNGPKIWKTSDIARMSHEDHIKNKDEILLAMSEGRIVEG